MLNKDTGRYGRDTLLAKFVDISLKVSTVPLLPDLADYCQRAAMDESGMNRARMGKHNRSVIVAVYGTPCGIPPRNNNSNNCGLTSWFRKIESCGILRCAVSYKLTKVSEVLPPLPERCVIMEAVSTSEILANFYETARASIWEDIHLYSCRREKLKSLGVDINFWLMMWMNLLWILAWDWLAWQRQCYDRKRRRKRW
jgi:hypothetical protein